MKAGLTPASTASTRSRRLRAHLATRLLSPGRRSRTPANLRNGPPRLHLGSGANVLAEWSNLDLVAVPGVLPWNLTKPLPVQDGSIDLVFSEHFIEHVTRDEGAALIAECYRVLRPGGALRVSTPDLRKLVVEYQSGRTDEWTDVGWHPASACQLFNEGVRSWGHLFIYDEDELSALLRSAGFRTVERRAWHISPVAGLAGLECRPDHDDLIVEATK